MQIENYTTIQNCNNKKKNEQLILTQFILQNVCKFLYWFNHDILSLHHRLLSRYTPRKWITFYSNPYSMVDSKYCLYWSIGRTSTGFFFAFIMFGSVGYLFTYQQRVKLCTLAYSISNPLSRVQEVEDASSEFLHRSLHQCQVSTSHKSEQNDIRSCHWLSIWKCNCLEANSVNLTA